MVIYGREVEGNKELRGRVKEYLRNLYCEGFEWKPKLDGINFNMLNEMSRVSLEQDFSEE